MLQITKFLLNHYCSYCKIYACVCHNKCIVRESFGMHTMKANAIMFENPTPKIYHVLSSSIEELDDVLAFQVIFTGLYHI